jgi:hypothetical protein
MNDTPNWERQLVEKLAMAALVEQRRARRWKIFFRLVWLGIIGGLLATAFLRNEDKSAEALTGGGHTAVISLEGVIDSENNTAEKLSAALEDAYDRGTRGIIIEANSPGGSPVLSGMAYDEIRRLKKQHPAIPVYVTVQEVCASGCYYIAAAADKIFVDKASIIGSIGVLSDGFGFTGLMDKLGVERRLKTAGENKAMGDPFSPPTPNRKPFASNCWMISTSNSSRRSRMAVAAGSRVTRSCFPAWYGLVKRAFRWDWPTVWAHPLGGARRDQGGKDGGLHPAGRPVQPCGTQDRRGVCRRRTQPVQHPPVLTLLPSRSIQWHADDAGRKKNTRTTNAGWFPMPTSLPCCSPFSW